MGQVWTSWNCSAQNNLFIDILIRLEVWSAWAYGLQFDFSLTPNSEEIILFWTTCTLVSLHCDARWKFQLDFSGIGFDKKKTLHMRYPYFLFQTHTHIHVHAPKIHDRQGMSFWECKSIFDPDWQRQAIPSWSNWETRRKLCYMLLGALFSINQRVFNLYFLVRKVGMEIGMILAWFYTH